MMDNGMTGLAGDMSYALSFEVESAIPLNMDDETLSCVQSKDDELEDKIDDMEETLTPQVGMCFDSLDEVKTFYKEYAYRHGFGIVVRNSKIKTTKDDERVKYTTFICEKGGKTRRSSNNILTRQPSVKTECKAKLNVKELEDGRVVILKIDFDHNHGLSPGKSRHLKSHKKINTWVKRKLQLNDQAGISVNKSFQSVVIQAGGYEKLTFDERKARNEISEARRLRFGMGDAESLNNYFIKMQKRNSNFFYELDLTDDGRIKNIFWADARSRALYESFGDAITFDTTYLTNKHAMPFAPFVGVNHHGQSILLGCGLLSNEEMDTYVWLFEAWLRCMSGVPPKAIVTDQCKSIGGAVAKVFKEAKHRLCLWHIMKKIPEKLRDHESYKPLKKVLKRMVYESQIEEEFEENWAKFIIDFNLGDNEWLESLYEVRKQWIPVFIKKTFWAGMSTTQRSESMNSFFDDYVNKNTSLRQFVEQYDNALKDKVEKESIADAASFHSIIPTSSPFFFEKQFQEAYTKSRFMEFQVEMKGLMGCTPTLVRIEGSMFIYDVSDLGEKKDGSLRTDKYGVYFIKDNCDISCVCHLFDFKGILCRHVLSVLIANEVTEIPSRYILTRWRKDIKRKHNSIKSSYDEPTDIEQVRRYDMMCDRFHSIALIGSRSEASSKLLVEFLDDMEKKIENSGTCYDENITEATNLNNVLKSPVKVRGKGRPQQQSKRIKSKDEIIKAFAKKKGSSNKLSQEKKIAKVTQKKGTKNKKQYKSISNEEVIETKQDYHDPSEGLGIGTANQFHPQNMMNLLLSQHYGHYNTQPVDVEAAQHHQL